MRVLPVLCLIFAACGSPMHVGLSRPGVVTTLGGPRAHYDGVVDGLYGFARGPEGSLYVASYRTGTVLHFRNGRYEGVAGAGLAGPTDVLVLPGGDLLVSCSGSRAHLPGRAFDGKGSLARVRTDGIVEPFVDSERIAVPTSLVAAEDGTIYVGQRGSADVLRLVDGKPVQAHAATDLREGPMHLAIGPDGALYAASAFEHRVVRVDPPAVVVDDENLGRPGGLAFDDDGVLYVTSYDRGEVRAYDVATGELLRIVAHGLARPWAIETE